MLNDQMLNLLSEKVDELGYTNAYVKGSDISKLKAYLDNDFIPHLVLKDLSQEEIAALSREQLQVYYEDYESHMKRMK